MLRRCFSKHFGKRACKLELCEHKAAKHSNNENTCERAHVSNISAREQRSDLIEPNACTVITVNGGGSHGANNTKNKRQPQRRRRPTHMRQEALVHCATQNGVHGTKYRSSAINTQDPASKCTWLVTTAAQAMSFCSARHSDQQSRTRIHKCGKEQSNRPIGFDHQAYDNNKRTH